MMEQKRFKGDEIITDGDKKISSLLAFWQWAYSDLVGNTERGVLAEYLVACALGVENNYRISWNRYDLTSSDGVTIEVKSSGYLQTWEQKQLSYIEFNISETYGWDSVSNEYSSVKKRQAKVYVFCVHKHKEQATINPLLIDQWDFYVLPTDTLNNEAKTQKTIRLSALTKVGAQKCAFGDIKSEISKYA
ncbi:MAG: hypothetical protein FWG88_08520 [Oscillospiraceae bacterium]|nr:hypothetical protein [Oscillospiraceae bacterium]